MLLTLQVLTQHLQVVTSTTFVDTKVPLLMTQDYSTVLMYRSKWYVPSVRTPSSQKLDLRQGTALLLTHLLRVLPRDQVLLPLTQTATIVALQLRTLCKKKMDIFHSYVKRVLRDSLFLC